MSNPVVKMDVENQSIEKGGIKLLKNDRFKEKEITIVNAPSDDTLRSLIIKNVKLNNFLTLKGLLAKEGTKEINTHALLLAGRKVDPESPEDIRIYENIIDTLAEVCMNVNIKYEGKQTPLERAIDLRSAGAVKILIKRGAHLSTDVNGNTQIHLVAKSDWCKGMNILTSHADFQESINHQNTDGDTAMHLAAKYGCNNCLENLLKYGGDVTIRNKKNQTVPYAICRNMAEPIKFFKNMLDKCITTKDNDPNSVNYELDLDFSFLDYKSQKQMYMISILLEATDSHQKLQLIGHPLIETFLRLKWFKLRMFYYILLIFYLFFVICHTAFIMLFLNGRTDEVAFMVFRYLTMSLASLLLVQSLVQLFFSKILFFQHIESYVHSGAAILAILITVDVTTPPKTWILHVASYGVLLVWTQLMLYIGRLPTCGYYTLLFVSVAKNICKVLLTFSCVIFGFAISFSVQFHSTTNFRYIWRSFVKTLTMMLGEFEYSDLFQPLEEQYDRTTTESMNENKTMTSEMDTLSGLHVTSRILFIVFLVVTSITLVNLMVGLAVNDIQCLIREGHVMRLVKQSCFLMEMEKLPRRLIRGRNIETKTKITKRKFVGNGIRKPLPMKIFMLLVEIAGENKRNETRKKATYRR